MKDEMALQKSP